MVADELRAGAGYDAQRQVGAARQPELVEVYVPMPLEDGAWVTTGRAVGALSDRRVCVGRVLPNGNPSVPTEGQMGYHSAAALHARRQGALSWRIR